MKTFLLTLVIVSMLLCSFEGDYARGEEGISFTENSLGKVPPGAVWYSIKFSPDGRHIAYTLRQDEKWVAVFDGKTSEEYDEVDLGVFGPFSRGQERTAYLARIGNKWRMIDDGIHGKEYDRIDNDYKFSPDGSKLAYQATLDNKMLVVINGVEGAKYERIISGVKFNSTSTRYAYAAEQEGKQFAVIDGNEDPHYDRIQWNIVSYTPFSPDGKRTAYVAERDGKNLAVVDGVEGNKYDGIEYFGDIYFSPRSQHYYYCARNTENEYVIVIDGEEIHTLMALPVYYDEDRQYVCVGYFNLNPKEYGIAVNGKKVAVCDWTTIFRPPLYGAISSDTKHYAFSATRGTESFIYIDGEEGKIYDCIEGVIFSADSKRCAYVAQRGTLRLAVVDGAESPEFEHVYSVFFSPDSKRVAASIVNNGKWTYWLDGKVIEDESIVYGLGFSTDSKKTAYYRETAINKRCVIVDDSSGPEFRKLHNRYFFSNPYVYCYLAESEDSYLIRCNGVESKRYEKIVSLITDGEPGIFSSKEHELHAIGFRDNEFFLIEADFSKLPKDAVPKP